MAETVKHTPGPWRVRPHWRDNARFEVYPDRKVSFGDPSEIAVVSGHYADNIEVETAEAKANADLISAAPDLLDALKEIKASVFGTTLGDEPNVYVDYDKLTSLHAKINDAIAKAEGRS